jgi:protein tyrosine phosphatase
MDMTIKLIIETEIYECLIQRVFKIYKDQKEIREITQIQMKNWPDHSVPKDKNGLKMIIDNIDKIKKLGNIIIHCSAGLGRTGCLIAIYNIYQSFILLKQINEELQRNIKPFFSVFNICRKLREQRQGMISNYQQYRFIYEYSAELAKVLFFD